MPTSFNRIRKTIDILGSTLRTRRDRRCLRELPDYLLRDIGLNRADVAQGEIPCKLAGAERWGSWG